MNDIFKTYDGSRKTTNGSLVMVNVPIEAFVVIPATSWADMA